MKFWQKSLSTGLAILMMGVSFQPAILAAKAHQAPVIKPMLDDSEGIR